MDMQSGSQDNYNNVLETNTFGAGWNIGHMGNNSFLPSIEIRKMGSSQDFIDSKVDILTDGSDAGKFDIDY